MKIDRNLLAHELRLFAYAVEKKGVLPVLNNVLLQQEGNVVTVRGTDLDNTLVANIIVTDDGQETVCVPLSKLKKAVDLNKNGEYVVIGSEETKHGQRAVINIGRFSMKTEAVLPENFPADLAEVPEKTLSIDREALIEAIKRVKTTATEEESRYALKALYFQFVDKELRVVSTDGHRLSVNSLEYERENRRLKKLPESFLLTRNGAEKLEAILRQVTDETVSLSLTDSHVFFHFENHTFSSRRASGVFPDYERVLPKPLYATVEFSATQAMEVIKKFNALLDKYQKCVKVEMNGAVSFETMNGDTHLSESIPHESYINTFNLASVPATEREYEEMMHSRIGLNRDYLTDLLRLFAKNQIVMQIRDSESAAIFKVKGDDAYYCAIMAMRIS